MKRRISRAPALNPWLLWTDAALKTAEMMSASAQVIGHRSRRLAAATTPLSKRDRKEFSLMGLEKVDAAVESAQSITKQALALDPLLGLRASGHMLATAAAMLSLASSRNVAQAVARQARLLRVASDSTSTLLGVSRASAALVHSGLRPVHSRAMANAKRLGKL
jgi:hypothetical protein